MKTVVVYTDPRNPACNEIDGFLRQQEFNLRVQDVTKDPLNKVQISELLRHFNIDHFIDITSKAYKKHNLDQGLPGRDELLQMMAEDNDLIRKPIIVAGRLMTVGCNIDKIKEMLQIKSNGTGTEDSDEAGNKRNNNSHRNREDKK